jgi:MFS family permease
MSSYTSPLDVKDERRFVIHQRWMRVFQGWIFSVAYVADVQHYIALCGKDVGMMAKHMGSVASAIALCNGILSPVFGSLSDTIGRVPVQALAGLGSALRCILIPLTTTLRGRMLVDIICRGVLEAPLLSVGGATHADVFGTRPIRSGEIRASEAMWQTLTVCITPTIAEYIAHFCGRVATFWAAALLAALSLIATITCPETLPSAQRRPFKVQHANPICSVWVLLSHGRRLRQLTAASVLRAIGVSLPLSKGVIHGTSFGELLLCKP